MPNIRYDRGRVWELYGEGLSTAEIVARLNYPSKAVGRLVSMCVDNEPDEPCEPVERCPHCKLTLPHYDCVSRDIADYIQYDSMR